MSELSKKRKREVVLRIAVSTTVIGLLPYQVRPDHPYALVAIYFLSSLTLGGRNLIPTGNKSQRLIAFV